VDNGVVKVKLDTEAQYAFTRATTRVPGPAKAESAMARRVAQVCEQLGSAGRSIVT
jgi:fructose/tagatose bisphosphate aldolase